MKADVGKFILWTFAAWLMGKLFDRTIKF